MSSLHAGHGIRIRPDVVTSPADVDNLLQWYAADQETGRTNGDVLASIPDRSGNGKTLTGATGPTWRNAANGIGGVPAFEFASGKEVSGSGRIVPLTGLTLMWVMSGWTAGRPIGLENDGSGTHGLGLYSGGWIIRNSGSTYDIGVAYTSSPIVATFRIGAAGTEAHTHGLASSGGGSRTDCTAFSDAGVNFTLGSSGNGGSDMTGKIAEFFSFGRRLPDAQFYQLLAYLRTKYSV